MEFTVRRILENDKTEIRDLRLEMIKLHPKCYNVDYNSWRIKPSVFWQEFAEKCSTSNEEAIFIALNNGKVVAMAHAKINCSAAHFGMLYVKKNLEEII